MSDADRRGTSRDDRSRAATTAETARDEVARTPSLATTALAQAARTATPAEAAHAEVAADVLHVAEPLSMLWGGRLNPWRVGYRLHGRPGAPVVLILGGISAHRVVGAAGAGEPEGWWELAVGAGRPFDPDKVAILSIDYLAGPGASTAPGPEPEAIDRFPAVATHDQAEAVVAVLRHLGIERVRGAVGASYGGMVALALAHRHLDRVGHAVLIGAAHESHPMATAIRSIQREIVRLGVASGRPRDGVRIARALAMTTYRTAAELAQRFDVAPTGAGEGEGGERRFPVVDYLDAQGARFAERFSPAGFLRLSESSDLHRVAPEEVRVPVTLIAVEEDTLVPRWQTDDLARRLPRCAGYHLLSSIFGHDAFLKEERIAALAADAVLGGGEGSRA